MGSSSRGAIASVLGEPGQVWRAVGHPKPKWPDWGVAEFLVRDTSTALSGQNGTSDFGVVHKPEDENYAHSEGHGTRDAPLRRPSPTLGLEFRSSRA